MLKVRNKVKFLAAAVVALTGLGVVLTDNTDGYKVANAESQSAYFNMLNGASVRYADDANGTGIRFESVISEAKYSALMAEGNTMVVLKSKITDANDATKKAFEQAWYLKYPEAQLGQEKITSVSFALNEETNTKEEEFYHTILFSSLFDGNNTELISQACALDLKCEMWLEVNGEKQTADNDVTSVVRSARVVANTAYEKDKNKANYDPTALSKYFGTRTVVNVAYFDELKVTETIASNVANATIEKTSALNLVLPKGTVAENSFDFTSYKMYNNFVEEKENFTAADFAVEVEGVSTSTPGTLKEGMGLTLFDDDNNVVYIPSALYVTKAIKEAIDLKVFDIVDNDESRVTANPLIIDGYYALVNDIKNSSVDYSNKHYGMIHAAANTTNGNLKFMMSTTAGYVEQGFEGTLDGQGYTMEVDVFSGGIFGALLLGAEIKNVSIDATFVNNANVYVGVLAHSMPQNSTQDGTFAPADDRIFLHNTYVHIADLRTNLNSSRTAGLVAYAHCRGLVMQDVLVEIDKHSLVDGTTIASGALFGSCSYRNIMGGRAAKNVYVISNGAILMSSSDSPTGTAALQNHKAVSMNDVTVGDNGAYTLNDTFKDYTFAGSVVYDDSTARNGAFYLYKNTFRYNSNAELMQKTTKVGNWNVTADKISWAE